MGIGVSEVCEMHLRNLTCMLRICDWIVAVAVIAEDWMKV